MLSHLNNIRPFKGQGPSGWFVIVRDRYTCQNPENAALVCHAGTAYVQERMWYLSDCSFFLERPFMFICFHVYLLFSISHKASTTAVFPGFYEVRRKLFWSS